jgi:formylglycine-generating enzyme required for sulfatase activity
MGISRSGDSGNYSYTTTNANMPVNFVSFWDAARFTNWLTTGDTEMGVYDLSDLDKLANNTLTRDEAAWLLGGVAVASENEWYKAAYYSGSPTGANGDGYWLYPTQSDSITTDDANYGNIVEDVTEVGTYTDAFSHYGTFDQGGNVREWNDTIASNNSSNRRLRGGAFNGNENPLQSLSGSSSNNPEIFEAATLGFRVSSLQPIPEPSAYTVILGCLGLSLALIRQKRRGIIRHS